MAPQKQTKVMMGSTERGECGKDYYREDDQQTDRDNPHRRIHRNHDGILIHLLDQNQPPFFFLRTANPFEAENHL